jgi:metallo-beta-lactamase class B
MKRQIKLATAAIFVTAMCAALTAKAADWYAPQEPFAIYGNTYYVGTGGISSVLIASPAGDPQYPNLDLITPVAHTRAVRDGETIKLGPLAVTAHFTPGHTKGATTWTWQSTEHGKTVNVVYADSLNPTAADGMSFSRNPLYPDAKANLELSIATVEALKCDVVISAHPEASGLWERKAKQVELGDAAFIDSEACRTYAAKARATLENTLAKEQR